MSIFTRLGRVPSAAVLTAKDVARAASVKAKLEKADTELTASHKKIFDLPSAQVGTGNATIRDLIVKQGNQYRPNAENGIYFSHRRLNSPEGISQLEGFADAVTSKNGAITAEGRRAKSQMAKIAYQASRGGNSARGVELAKAVSGLGPQASYILSRTGFMDRLKSLGSSEMKKYADTARLLEMIETSDSGQWDAIIKELQTARKIYSTSSVRI